MALVKIHHLPAVAHGAGGDAELYKVVHSLPVEKQPDAGVTQRPITTVISVVVISNTPLDRLQAQDGIPAKVERIEYDPNRTANIALLCYADGERHYIIATKGMAVGDSVMNGSEAPIKSGNCLPIRNIPVGTVMHCVEMLPGKGAQMARTAGAGVVLMAREGTYAQVRLRSGEVRRVHIECRATVGEVGNAEHSLRKIGKAGAMRWRGVRPTVRGVVMNRSITRTVVVKVKQQLVVIQFRLGANRLRVRRHAATSVLLP